MVELASEFDGVSLHAGDIVFMAKSASTRQEKVVTAINVSGQRLLAALRRENRLSPRARLGAWSHVLLALGGGTVIHADGRSVVIETTREAFDVSREKLHFAVFRRNGLSQNQVKAVTQAAKRYLAQKYKFRAYFERTGSGSGRDREDTTQFCSRLVAHSFAVAGLPFSTRPEHRVLPIDLYAACQVLPWRDVTPYVARQRWKGANGSFLDRLEVPGRGELSMSEFFQETSALMDRMAELGKSREYASLKSYDNILLSQATIGVHTMALLKLAKQTFIDPSLLENAACDTIARILEQIEELLALSLLPEIDLVVQRLDFGGSESDRSTYAGRLRPTELHEMQRLREQLRFLSYILFASTGLKVLVAHATNSPKFALFRTARKECADRFLAALAVIPDLSEYDVASQDLFAWVSDAADRKVVQVEFGNILGCLKIVSLLRGGGRQKLSGC